MLSRTPRRVAGDAVDAMISRRDDVVERDAIDATTRGDDGVKRDSRQLDSV